jgi:hypothetical protein
MVVVDGQAAARAALFAANRATILLRRQHLGILMLGDADSREELSDARARQTRPAHPAAFCGRPAASCATAGSLASGALCRVTVSTTGTEDSRIDLWRAATFATEPGQHALAVSFLLAAGLAPATP